VSRTARFAWVGVGGFVVQAAVLSALAAAGLPYPLATAVAVETAILHNFFWHERWTWADRAPRPGRGDGRHRVARLLRFNGSTAVISIAGNVALMGLFVGVLRLPLLAANLLAVLTLAVVNFVCADRLVFATKLTRQPSNPTPM
jgi:putative flippase GtrA